VNRKLKLAYMVVTPDVRLKSALGYPGDLAAVNGHLRIPNFGHEKSPRYPYHT
jgi:hypothetical protein